MDGYIDASLLHLQCKESLSFRACTRLSQVAKVCVRGEDKVILQWLPKTITTHDK